MGKKSGSGSGMNNPDHISESLEPFFGLKYMKFFDADPGSGIEKNLIKDGTNSDPRSGINIRDPQHCIFDNISFLTGHKNRIHNYRSSWIRIHKSELWIGGSRSERNVYVSTTLVCTYIKYRYQE